MSIVSKVSGRFFNKIKPNDRRGTGGQDTNTKGKGVPFRSSSFPLRFVRFCVDAAPLETGNKKMLKTLKWRRILKLACTEILYKMFRFSLNFVLKILEQVINSKQIPIFHFNFQKFQVSISKIPNCNFFYIYFINQTSKNKAAKNFFLKNPVSCSKFFAIFGYIIAPN